jgi:hypothetical protein
VLAIVVFYFLSCIRILREYERGVVFRLGRVLAKGPASSWCFGRLTGWSGSACGPSFGTSRLKT